MNYSSLRKLLPRHGGDVGEMTECTQKIPLKDSRWGAKMRPAAETVALKWDEPSNIKLKRRFVQMWEGSTEL